MSYIINNSRGNIVAVVDDGTVNTTATDLALIGRSVVNYGEYQNENYVYLLENFAKGSAPLQPVLGQLWYNSNTDTISAYSTENTWTALASQPYVDAQKISPAFTGVPTAPTASSATNTTQLATTAFVQNNKISPAFTGVPTAPTAISDTNTTQLATTAFVQNQLSAASGFSSAGNISAAGFSTTGLVSVTGNVLGGNIATGGNVVALGQITTIGNVTGGNINTVGQIAASGNISGGNVLGGANVSAVTHTGTTVSVTGNITGGNVISNGARVYKYTASASVPSNGVPGDNWYATNTDKLYLYINDGTSSQWVDQSFPTSISSLAIVGNLSVGGTLTAANINLSGGTFSVDNLLNSGANGSGNIGSSTGYFNQVFATATTALYADLAENYQADGIYKPGTVVVFGGKDEITVSDIDHDTRIAGVVSTNPAYLMNSSQADGTPVALTGRVPCFVQGPVTKGDRLVNVASGVAGKFDPVKAELGCVVGKSLQDLPGDHVELIEIAVGRT